MLRRVWNCPVFRKFIYNTFRDLLVFTIWNLYFWIDIFSLIAVIYFILVVNEKLVKKLEKEYLKSKYITNFKKFFIACGIIKLTKVFTEGALQRCSYKKAFWKYAANLQENTHAEMWFQQSYKVTLLKSHFVRGVLQ